jgi:hypothetical protein
MIPSSGETIVFLRLLVLVILCGWLSAMQGGMKVQFHSTLYLTSFYISALSNHIVKIVNTAQRDFNSKDFYLHCV